VCQGNETGLTIETRRLQQRGNDPGNDKTQANSDKDRKKPKDDFDEQVCYYDRIYPMIIE
jgi:hypothetical protein